MNDTTYLSELYDDFLSSIEEYSYMNVNVTTEDIKDDLDSYFKKAKAKFRKCKNSLNLLKDENGLEYFGYLADGEEIKVVLTDFEKSILIHLMLVEYLKPKVLSSSVLRPNMSDKAFKIYSQANQLRELGLLYRQIQKECNKLITEYTYLDLEEKR